MLSQSITLPVIAPACSSGRGLRMMTMTDDLVALLLPSGFLFLRPNVGITRISLWIKSEICLMLCCSCVLMIALSHPLSVAI